MPKITNSKSKESTEVNFSWKASLETACNVARNIVNC